MPNRFRLIVAISLAGLAPTAHAAAWICKPVDKLAMDPSVVTFDTESRRARASFFQNPNTTGEVVRVIRHGPGFKVNLRFYPTQGFDRGKLIELMIFTVDKSFRIGGATYSSKGNDRSLDRVQPGKPAECSGI